MEYYENRICLKKIHEGIRIMEVPHGHNFIISEVLPYSLLLHNLLHIVNCSTS